MKLFLPPKVIAGFCLALIIFIGNALVSYQNTLRLIEANASVTHSLTVLKNLEGALSTLIDAETGQRGYLITGQPSYLEPYQTALESLPQNIQTLRQLTANNPRQQQRLDALDLLMAEKLTNLKETIALRQNQDFAAAQAVVLTGQGKQIMDDIRALINQMQTEENTLLTQRIQAAQTSGQITLVTFFVAALMGIGLLALLYYLVNRHLAERRQAEGHLRQSEERFVAAFQVSPYGLMINRLADGQIIEVNNHWQELFGYSRAEAVGQTYLNLNILANLADRARVRARLEEDGFIRDFELEIRRKSGEVRQASMSAEMIKLDHEPGLLVLVRDITDHKQAEAALRESEEWLRLAYDAADLGLWRHDMVTNMFYFDDCARAHYGFDTADVPFAEVFTHIHPGDLARLEQEIALTIDPASAGRYATEYRVIHPNGAIRWLAVQARVIFAGEAPARQPVLGYGTSQDITDRKQAEQAQTYLAAIVESSNDAIIGKDLQGNILSWNSGAERIFGYSANEIIGQPITRLIPPNRLDEEVQILSQIKQGERMRNFETVRLDKKGQLIDVSVTISPIVNALGEVVGASKVAHDITERKQTEEALRESEARYRRTLDNMLGACQIIDFDWRYIYLNEAAAAQGKHSPEELLQHTMMEIYPGIENTELFTILRRCMEERSFEHMENKFVYPDGTNRWFELSIQPVPEGVFILSLDITERKRTQEALKKSEASLAKAQQIAHLGSWELDLAELDDVDSNNLRWSDEVYRIFGYNPGEFEPSNELFFRAVPADEIPLIQQGVAQAIAEKKTFSLDHRIVLSDGTERIVHEYGDVICDDLTGRPLWLFGIIQDITERKQAEESLRQSQDNFARAFNSSPAALAITRLADGKFLSLNEAYSAIMGYQPVEILGRTATEMNIYLNLDERDQLIQQLHEQGAVRNCDLLVRTKSGQARNLLVAMEPTLYNNEKAIISTFLDMTERKRAEEQLRQSELRYRLLHETMMQGVVHQDVAGTIISMNPAAEQILGWTTSEFLGQSSVSIERDTLREDGSPFPGMEHPAMVALRTGQPVRNVVMQVYNLKLRQYRWITVTAVPLLREGEDSAYQVYAIFDDITERKQAEAALRQSDERFAKAFRASPAALSITRLDDGCFVDVNESFQRIFGYSREELIGHGSIELNMFANPDERTELIRRLQEQGSVRNYDMTMRAKSGELRNVLFSTEMIELDGEAHALAILFDITERKRAEEELRQTAAELARSNAELEQFAYIASHDLQEPLRAVAGMLQLLQQRYTSQLDARADEFITHAVEAVTRMQTLINDLLNFSRVGTRGLPFQETDCALILGNTQANLSVAIRESGVVISHDPLPTLMADPTQLTQLFQNLVGNAIKFCSNPAPAIHIGAEQGENEWVFAVRDNGIGMEAQYFERIFGVFQRLHTRRDYPGTGIGLAICKKIVERHGGRIWVESEPGQGSTFYFSLPERKAAA